MRFLNLPRAHFAGLGIAFLSACAGNPDAIPAGTNRAAVLASLGQPTAVWPLHQGERLQYSNQPWGQQVYNVDMNSDGRVATTTQVLTATGFAAVLIDAWRTQDVLRAFGKPASVGRVHSFDGSVWSYRYAEPFGLNKQFHVFMDANGLVRRTQVTDESALTDDRVGMRH